MRQPKPERIALLSSEQRQVYESWLVKEEEMSNLMQSYIAALENNDYNLVSQIRRQLADRQSDTCEHGRSIWSSCIACDEIDQVLYPEFFNANGERKSPEEIEQMLDKDRYEHNR